MAEQRLERLREQVIQMLRSNRVEEERDWNGNRRLVTYHAPSLGSEPPDWRTWITWPWRDIIRPWQVRYPHQWFWDSCAHAVVLCHIDIALARSEVEALLYAQRADGFIPHMIWNKPEMNWLDRLSTFVYPSRHMSPYLQPPLLADAVEAILAKSGDTEFVRAVLPRVKNYYHFLDKVRNASGDGLLEIIISYESGKDRSPEYDGIYGHSFMPWPWPIMREVNRHRRLGWDDRRILAADGFRVKDLLFNCVYAQSLEVLGGLCCSVGDGEEEIFRARARTTEAAILARMYDAESGLFYSLDSRGGGDRQLKASTVSALLPLLLESIEKPKVDRLVNDYLRNRGEFWAEYPVPAEPLSCTDQNTCHIWRGRQTWIFTNWLVVRGLAKQARRFPDSRDSYLGIASAIAEQTCKLVEQQGFREYYDADTGKGCRARNFGWSALALDMALSSNSGGS